MSLLDLFGKREREVILDVATIEKWPERLLRQQRLHDAMAGFLSQVDRAKRRVRQAKSRFTDHSVKEEIPKRALPVYEEHLPLLVRAVERLLKETEFIDDIFLVEEQQESFSKARDRYKEETQKTSAALKEYLGEELQELTDALRDLEDSVVGLSPLLEEGKLARIREVKRLVDQYKEARAKEAKLQQLRSQLMTELDALEQRRRKIKEKIAYYMEKARNGRYKELISEEEELLEQSDAIKVKELPKEEEEKELHPIIQRLAFIRKQMISDITALNINEQRTFLEAVKDEIRLRKRKLERIEEILAEQSHDAFMTRFKDALEPFKVRIEEATAIIEREDDDVAPQ